MVMTLKQQKLEKDSKIRQWTTRNQIKKQQVKYDNDTKTMKKKEKFLVCEDQNKVTY